MPGDLTDRFLAIASSNSQRGVETLGTLGGSLSNNRLIISHLLIPKQVGKSDSCTMEGLEDVWDVHDKENIVFLGWIHTHPAYSVFLSSVDMHNQYEWQHMLPEVREGEILAGLLTEEQCFRPWPQSAVSRTARSVISDSRTRGWRTSGSAASLTSILIVRSLRSGRQRSTSPLTPAGGSLSEILDRSESLHYITALHITIIPSKYQ